MESRIITPGPYRATKLWNEVTKYFRAGMPLKRHRIHFKTYGNCFTSSEAIDWLHQLLRNNSNFGTEVTRQQTIQLLRKFLKNHVIEDLKGRWGTEDLEDNHNLYRFPSTSPVKTIPNRQPLWKRSSLENVFKEKDNMFKMPHFSKKTPKRHNSLDSQGQQENEEMEMMEDQGCDESGSQELTQKDVEDIWGNITLNHLQKILALPSLEEVLNPAQINPAHIMYNMTHTSKHGVVFLQDKTDDLPHWVLSAMKCLANWPRNNDLSQPTYPGFEGDVFRTVADYFLNLPGPLLTYEYYELFVNILVVCGYITVPRRRTTKRKPKKGTSRQQPSKPLQSSDTNFKSTECLLLSLLRKVPNEEEQDDVDTFGEIGRQRDFDLKNSQRAPLHGTVDGQSTGGSRVIGGSCQNLSVSGRGGSGPYRVRVRSCSLEGIADVSGSSNDGSIADSSSSKPCSPNLPSEDHSALLGGNAFSLSSGGQPQTLQLWPDVHRYAPFHDSRRLPRSQSLGDCLGSSFSINAPVAEITMKPNQSAQNRLQKRLSSIEMMEMADLDFTVTKRLCQSTMELSSSPSSSPLMHASQPCTGTPSLLQPHLERVAIDALQVCCLLLPPPNRRKLQLLMRMISRMSQNVDMPRLHDAMGTRSLMIQTFSRCVLCCAEEVDLDELLATRLVSFLMDHHQEVLQVPCYLQTAVQEHIHYLQRPRVKGQPPGFYFCKQISTQEFEEQKVVMSQVAIMDLLESIVKDKNISVKDKKKKLKQFQKEYPEIYKSRFPTTESEAKLFGDKPTIKQPMLVLKRPKFRNLRH